MRERATAYSALRNGSWAPQIKEAWRFDQRELVREVLTLAASAGGVIEWHLLQGTLVADLDALRR